MLTLRSILQHVCQLFKGLAGRTAKRLYRSSAVFMTGAALITAIAFTSAGIGMEGGNAITAFAETPAPSSAAVVEGVSVTKAKAQVKQSQNIQQNQKDDQTSEEENHIKAVSQEAADQSIPAGPGITESSGSADGGETAAAPEASPAGGNAKQDESQPAEEAKNVNAMAISDDDYQVLLKIVQAEAGICDEEGRILVANVVLNRVRNSQFPNTVRGVVYAPSQFSPVSNGTINSVQVTATTKECVDRALKGEDYSQGALYFMNRGGARVRAVSWFDSHLTYLFSHDGHEFFK